MSRASAYLLGVVSGATAALAIGALAALAGGTDPSEAARASRPSVSNREAPAAAQQGSARRRGASSPFASLDPGEIPPPPRGDGAVTGRVLDWQGRPMPGVAVRAEPWDPPVAVGERPTSDPDERLRRELRDVVRADRFRREWGRTCVTDATGAFTFAGLGVEPWAIEALRDGWEFTTGERKSTSAWARSGEWVSFTGHRRYDVDVSVVQPDGTSPAAARVTVETGRRRVTTAWSPADRTVSLRAGKSSLYVTSGAADELTSDSIDVDVPEDAEPAAIRVSLAERSGVIVGVGAGGDGAPCCAEVSLVPEEGKTRTETTAPGGYARFHGIDPGRWTLVVSNGIGEEFHRETLDVGTAIVRRDVPLPARDLRDWRLVRLLDASGRPVEEADFRSGFGCDDAWATGRVAAVRVDCGVWRVPLYPANSRGCCGSNGEPDTRTATRRWISVDAGALGDAWADAGPASASEVVMRLVAPAQLVVRVEGIVEGGPEIEVVAENDGPDSAPANLGVFRRRADVASDEVELRLLPPRPARVSLTAVGETVAETRVTLASGENRVTLVAPRFQDLRVTVAGGTSPERIWLRRESADGKWKWMNPDESSGDVATWRHLLPGPYRVWCQEGDMPVTVPCATDIRMAPRPFTAIRFAPEDDSPMHAAGLRRGDVCVQLDGAAFDGMRQIDAVLAAARLKSRSTLAIVRGDRRFDLDVDLSQLTLRWDYLSR